MSELSDKDGDDESGDGSSCVGKGHQCSGVVGSNVDVIGEESAVHAGHKHGTKRHESDGGVAVTTCKAHTDETGSRQERSWTERGTQFDCQQNGMITKSIRTDGSGELAHGGRRDPAFALGPVQAVAPNHAKHPQRQVGNGRQQRVLQKKEAFQRLSLIQRWLISSPRWFWSAGCASYKWAVRRAAYTSQSCCKCAPPKWPRKERTSREISTGQEGSTPINVMAIIEENA